MLKVLLRKIYLMLSKYRINNGSNRERLKALAKNCYKCKENPIINPFWAYDSHKWMQKTFGLVALIVIGLRFLLMI